MALENTDKALASVIDQISGLVTTQSADAVALAGRVYQLNAQGTIDAANAWMSVPLVAGVIMLVALTVLIWDIRRNDGRDAVTVPAGIVAGASFIVFGLGLLIAGSNWMDVRYDYVLHASAADPKIALAKAVLDKIH